MNTLEDKRLAEAEGKKRGMLAKKKNKEQKDNKKFENTEVVAKNNKSTVIHAQTQAAVSTLALAESYFLIFEFLCVLVFSKSATTEVYNSLFGVEGQAPSWLTVAMSNIVTTGWMTYRTAGMLKLDVLQLWTRLMSGPVMTRLGLFLICLHICSSAALATAQYFGFHSLYSYANYMRTGEWDWAITIDMLFLAPLREELVFRAALFCICYRRLGDASAASKIKCVWHCSAAFGGVHLLNFLSPNFNPGYVTMQILLGCLIGSQYALSFVLNGSLAECLLLHIWNNICSSFLPLDAALDFTNPFVFVSFGTTILVYTLTVQTTLKQVLPSISNVHVVTHIFSRCEHRKMGRRGFSRNI